MLKGTSASMLESFLFILYNAVLIMTTKELDSYFRELLNIDAFKEIDASMNGLQVDNDGRKIKKVAFAVDASLGVFNRAHERGADFLFTHHGLFWKKPLMLVGPHYKRIEFLIRNNLALYACHLPLDAHPLYGNNAGIATKIGLEDRKGFAILGKRNIGIMGVIEETSIDDILQILFSKGDMPSHVLPFGTNRIRKIAILSGSGATFVDEAIEKGVDLYITGEIKHETYNKALEAHLNVIAGGHYNTETYGVELVKEKLECDFDIETCFINLPTGL